MYSVITTVLLALFLAGCSSVTVTASMCQELQNDPSAPPIPKECKDYSEKAAKQAFDKVVDEKKVSDQDIKFIRDEE
jgi:PBP1b-binding outer membrane lipoprotein LpoB